MSIARDGLLSLGVFTPASGSTSPSPLPSDDFLHLKTANTIRAIIQQPPITPPIDMPMVSAFTGSDGGGAAAPVTTSASAGSTVGFVGPTGPTGPIGSSGTTGSTGSGVGVGYGGVGSIAYCFNSSVQVGATFSKRKVVKSVFDLSQS